jgi:4-amino-4-deoxy-L-arabinose transferase-like glycosyltransferase
MKMAFQQRWLLTLFTVALIARIVWVLLHTGEGLSFSDDAKAYHDLAVNLVERHDFVTAIDPPHRIDIPYASRPPLTPFVLATAYSVFGPHLLAGQMLLAVLGASTVVAVYLLGKDLFSSEVAILGSVLVALYPFFVFLAAVPLTENVAIPLNAFVALALTRGAKSGAWHHAAASGGLLGLATLNRPQVLGFFPLLVPLVALGWGSGWNAKVRSLVMMLACSAVVIAPWVVRNYIVFHHWVPVSLQGGSALYQGNNQYAQTALTKLELGARGWYNDPRWGRDLAGLSPVDADRVAFDQGVGFMREHPVHALDYAVQKVSIFFGAYEHPVSWASWYPVLALSLLGFWWTAREWRRLLPIYLLVAQTILTAAIFTSMPRFRAPVEPFFIVLAALAFTRLRHGWAVREWPGPA